MGPPYLAIGPHPEAIRHLSAAVEDFDQEVRLDPTLVLAFNNRGIASRSDTTKRFAPAAAGAKIGIQKASADQSADPAATKRTSRRWSS
jgi:hypothetical protein